MARAKTTATQEPLIASDAPVGSETSTKKKRNYPPLMLQRSLSVARAIQDGASGMSVNRLTLAELMENSPSSSTFVTLLQASRMYGLTTGGVNAPTFALTPLGNDATGGDEVAQQVALRKAVLSIEPYNAFLSAFNGKRVPAPNVCKEFLVTKAKVPSERVDECMQFILSDARFVSFTRKVQGNEWIDLQVAPTPVATFNGTQGRDDDADDVGPAVVDALAEPETAQLTVPPKHPVPVQEPQQPSTPKKVFIAHGKDRGPLEQVKKMLEQFKVKYAVAVDEANRGRPISAKVANLMRDNCSSAIFIFTADERFYSEDEHGNRIEVWRPSENVVYELGAASVLYDRRIVIFKDKRVTLASDFSDLGYIPFEEGQIAIQMGQLFSELVGLDILEVRAKG